LQAGRLLECTRECPTRSDEVACSQQKTSAAAVLTELREPVVPLEMMSWFYWSIICAAQVSCKHHQTSINDLCVLFMHPNLSPLSNPSFSKLRRISRVWARTVGRRVVALRSRHAAHVGSRFCTRDCGSGRFLMMRNKLMCADKLDVAQDET
jgi:hypothetical protein